MIVDGNSILVIIIVNSVIIDYLLCGSSSRVKIVLIINTIKYLVLALVFIIYRKKY